MQAKGAMMQLLAQRETTFRTAPASPDALLLPFTKWNLGRDPGKTVNPSLSASPLPDKSGCGNATVQGSAESILDLRSIGFWLSLALGVPTTHKAVTQQPTNVTGVTIHYAESACPAGNGTLDFTAAGSTLEWTANGETVGTAVDVSAGGRFTLPSGTASHGLVVEVAAGALPVTDKTDADIAVSAVLKAHVFPIDMNDRPSALMELGHTDIGKFYRSLGVKVNRLSYDIAAAEQNVSLDLIGGSETVEASAWDGTPTAHATARACGHGGFIGNGSSTALGDISGGTFSLDNGMSGKKLLKQQEGFGLISQGEVALSGNVEAVFDGAGAYALARAGTSTRMRLGSAAIDGAHTFHLWFDMPNVEFVEKVIPKEGKSGLFASLDWRAHRDTAGNLPMVTLINDVTSY